MKLSVIIPTLDEAGCLRKAIASARAMRGDCEIIVAEGGSADGTADIARDGEAQVLQSAPGRAAQMNSGAAAASGEVFLFLHADTILPATAHEAITAALADPEVGGGCFRLRFDHGHPVLRFSAFFTRFRFRFFHYGDSAYFVRRKIFESLQGFRLFPLMEDIDFWRRLNRQHKTVIVNETVVTSARRFLEHGVVRQQALAVCLVVLYALGVAPSFLARLYYRRQPKVKSATSVEAGNRPAISFPANRRSVGHVFRSPSAWDRIKYPIATLWRWSFSNAHMIKQTLNVLDFMWLHKVGPGLLADDHPWLTGKIPGTNETIWAKNIVFASPRKPAWQGREPEDDAIIVSRVGAFLASMVARSNVANPEIPQGKQRRMPHAVNYIHGSVHYNGGYVLFNDFEDAMFYLSDAKFAGQFRKFAAQEKRELTIVLRERSYDPEEYAWFLAFVRSHLIWYANANGPTKKRVLHGTPSPYPAVNPINGSWIRDVRNLQKGRLDCIVFEPLRGSNYFTGVYQGNQCEYTFLERFHAWAQYLVTRAKGFQGGLVFTDRKKIEPEHWGIFRTTQGKWQAGYPVSHPFTRIPRRKTWPSLKPSKPTRASRNS
jgi:rSAM/selenodomain-associated transferase 2